MSEAGDREEAKGLPPNFSEMLDKVLANPEIISSVAAALSKGKDEEKGDGEALKVDLKEKEGETSFEPSPDISAMMQKLPEVMKIVGPMMSKGEGKHTAPRESDRRACLLTAIKPYLSPHRCEAVDYIIKFSQLREIIKRMY